MGDARLFGPDLAHVSGDVIGFAHPFEESD